MGLPSAIPNDLYEMPKFYGMFQNQVYSVIHCRSARLLAGL